MKSKKKLSVISLALAVLMIAAALSGCGGTDSTLKANKDYAADVISDFNSKSSATELYFANDAFSKAKTAAMMYKPGISDEDMEKIAKSIMLTSITVADAKGNIVACYPKGAEKGKLKDSKDKFSFYKVAKGISEKAINDNPPYNAETNTYAIFAGVKRVDADGAVVVGYDSADYAKVTGIDLANSCGANAVVIKEGKVLSSTLDGIERDKSLDDIGISEDDLKKDSFTFKTGDKSYNALSAKNGDLTVICASPA